MKIRIAAALAAASMIVSMAASPGALAQEKSITVGVAAPPQTMNPHGSDADSNLSVMSNIFEGLLRRDTSGKLMPALATSWERIDKNTWRFKLREGVKFHNGNAFTWEDVQFTFDRLKNPEVSEFISFGSLINFDRAGERRRVDHRHQDEGAGALLRPEPPPDLHHGQGVRPRAGTPAMSGKSRSARDPTSSRSGSRARI